MKKLLLALITVVAVVSGCAGNRDLVKEGTVGARTDVFVEVADGTPIPQGYADLLVKFSMKTHNPGAFAAKDVHGTPDYKLLLNVDGQVVQVQARLYRENTEPTGLRDPEAGEGTRYLFRKTIRLAPGTHKVVIAIPSDGVAAERDIVLSAGKVNKLALEPVYSVSPEKTRPHTFATSYKQGLRTFRVSLNDSEL